MPLKNQTPSGLPSFARDLRFWASSWLVFGVKHIVRAQKSSAIFALATACAMAQAQTAPMVGEVSLVLGNSYRLSQMGARERLERGSEINLGDQIETQANGHVHVRFVDNALVSVRPNSLLVVQRYDYNADSPADSAVKFELQEGVTRAISGEAAKAARDRFRLNTPIAAIGVRGTDFVVSVDAKTTRAMVNEGAIVLAPYSAACSADKLGPCQANALELTGSTLQLASVELDEPTPILLPSQNVRAPDVVQEKVRLAVASNNGFSEQAPKSAASEDDAQQNADQEVSNDVLLEGVTTVQVRADVKVAVETVSAKDFIPADPVIVVEGAAGAVAQFDLTPPTMLTSAALSNRQLVWGRYADTPLSTDRLALSTTEAKAFRNITVGSLDYGLFRAEPGPRRVASDLGLVGFELTSAQAVFNSTTGVFAMTVNGGNLNIDFQDRAFSTELDLMSDATGSVLFTANGGIADGGFLRAIEATQRLSGAVSFDGSEAGYLFEKQIGSGAISGLTLWDSK